MLLWKKENLILRENSGQAGLHSAIFVGTACPGAGRGRRLPQRMFNTPRLLNILLTGGTTERSAIKTVITLPGTDAYQAADPMRLGLMGRIRKNVVLSCHCNDIT